MTPPDMLRHAQTELQLDGENPWPGLASYDEASRHFFSGRTLETAELLRRILDEPVTVLFGKSGLGKTSLLKAGVFPRLRDRDLLPVLVRLQIRPGAGRLIDQLGLALADELRAQQIDHVPSPPGESLWEYLHTADREFWSRQNRLVRPVFILDQFEEVFTLGRAAPADVESFREDLADLAENRIPEDLARRLEADPSSGSALNVQAMPYKVVLSLREDFLADLEGWRQTMPSLRRNRMRLLPMGPDQALKAVCNERTNHLVPKSVAEKIVAFLSSGAVDPDDGLPDGTGPTIEPALLSLFCRGINEHRKRDDKTQFDLELLEGAKGTIVADFYRASLEDQPRRVRKFIEEELITEHGYRNSYSVEDAVARGVTTTSLDTLINRHLLRYEHHLGAERIELTHDLLTGAVVEERELRRLAERAERERQQRWRLVGVAAVLAFAAILFAGFALRARSAERDANIERDRSLAALAGTTMNKDPELAIALALEALRRSDIAEARSALVEASQYAWPSADLGKDQLGDVPQAVALSGDGARLAVLAANGAITAWDVTVRHPSMVWPAPVARPESYAVAFSPDRTRLAIASKVGIELLDAVTGKSLRVVTLDPALDDRRLMFSPDGQWLGATKDGDNLWLLDVRQAQAAPERIPTPGVLGFAVVSGTRVVAVPSDLQAYSIDKRNGDWQSTPFNLSNCMNPQSVSAGSALVSATWQAHACTFDAAEASAVNRDTAERAVDDIIWSPGGRISAELLIPQGPFSQEVVVRGSDAESTPSRIKGAHIDNDVNEKSRLIAVDESGTRVALIDDDEHKAVRVYSLAGYKPFQSPFQESALAVAPDGHWMALQTSARDATSAVIDVIHFDQAFTSGNLLGGRPRIVLDGVPQRIAATDNALIAVMPTDPVTTLVFDATTGTRRFDPIIGAAYPIGDDGALLLASASEGQPARVLRTRDGATMASWAPPTPDGRVTVSVSRRRQAIAVMRVAAPSAPPAETLVYTISAESVVPAGHVFDLPGSMRRALFVPRDDGRTVTDGRRAWTVTTESDRTRVPAVVEVSDAPETASPSGRFEIRRVTAGDDAVTITIVKRATRAVITRFPAEHNTYRFSDDERWLAVFDTQDVRVYDLEAGRTALTLSYPGITDVDFVGGRLISLRMAAGVVLVPVERPLIECFGRWLTDRTLTAEERSKYGLPRTATTLRPCQGS